MRYRLTFVVGLAVGYVLGTRSGRERYEQLKKTARQVAQNPAVRNTAESPRSRAGTSPTRRTTRSATRSATGCRSR
ncbi:hypothetical protein SFUMM280S_07560 [Streptomyces fumanus]